jgi:hypothetical protein
MFTFAIFYQTTNLTAKFYGLEPTFQRSHPGLRLAIKFRLSVVSTIKQKETKRGMRMVATAWISRFS